MKDDRVYLLHIRDAIQRVIEYTADGETAFFADTKTQDAVVRNLEIIGEAVKKLSKELRDANPGTPWKRIAGMRDKMIHEYFGINLRLVFEVVRLELPKLKTQVAVLIERLSKDA